MRNTKFDKSLYFILSIVLIIEFISSYRSNSNILICILFFLIGLISFVFFILDKRMFSINKFILIYFFIFSYLAPYKQYLSNYNAWKLYIYSDEDYILANILVLVFLVVYLFFYNILFQNKYINKKDNKEKKICKLKLNKSNMIILTLINIVCLLYLNSTNKLIKLDEFNTTDTSIRSFTIIIQFIPVAIMLIYIYIYRLKGVEVKKYIKNIFLIINGLILIIIYFPINGVMPRFFLLGTYITISIVLFEKFKHKSLLLICMIIGFAYIFPAMNFFKYYSISNLSEFVFGGLDFNFYDYDAHQLFMLTIGYTKTNGFLLGKNLLTSIFCFIPRSIWSGKLLPSGELVSLSYNASFTNLSCPIYGELYLAFGIFGIMFGATLLAYIIKKLEVGYLKDSILIKGICTICMGMSIYYMRGAMLPATSFLFSMIIAYLIIYIICKLLSYKII